MAHHRTWNNAKIRRFAKEIGEPLPHAIGHLEAFWHDAYQNHLPHGRYRPEEVEEAARWDGPSGEFLTALRKTVLVNQRRGWVYIHDFRENAPDYVKKRIDRMLQKQQRRTTAPHGGQSAPFGGSTKPNPTKPKEPPIVPLDEKVESMEPTAGETPFGPRPDIMVDAAVNHLDEKWKDMEADGHRNIPKWSPDQIAKFLTQMRGILEVQKVTANDIHRAWLRYGARMGDPKQKDIPWCPWYLRDLLTRDAARQTPRRQQRGLSRIDREIAAFKEDGGIPNPTTQEYLGRKK